MRQDWWGLSHWTTLLVPFALVAAGMSAPGWASETGPSAVIDSLHAGMLEVMKKGDELGYAGRYEELAPLVEASHDLEFIARSALGRRYWKGLDEQQQQTFVDVFRHLSLATYAIRFKAYSGEQFERVGEQELPRGDVLVRSVLSTSKGEQFQFDYQLRAEEETWRIVNIIVDGVSDLALKRAEYTDIMKERGFAALLAYLEQQIDAARETAGS